MKRKFLILAQIFVFSVLVQSQSIEKKIFIPPPGENASRYFYLPFDVPAGTKSVAVSYEYDKKDGANVLDLGLFDTEFDATEKSISGARGWSGGRRGTVFVAEDSATNGYVAGKIPAGTWRVVFGLYKIAPEGVEVAVKIKFDEIDARAREELQSEKSKVFAFSKKLRVAPTKANGWTWYRGDLHLHTFYSDGHWTVKGILEFADANNLDFISITEHNTFAHHREIDALAGNYPNLLVLRGEEVTTYGGHFNVWGLPPGGLVDFRVSPQQADTAKRLAEIVAGVRAQNLLASINHPTALCGGCAWTYGDWAKMNAVEIWNGEWDEQDEAALKKWDELLQQGKRLAAVGSSDTHRPPTAEFKDGLAIGTPTNHVGMKRLTQNELLAAVKQGRLWLGASPTDYNLEFSLDDAKKKATLGETALVKAVAGGESQTVKLNVKTSGLPKGSSVSVISDGKILLAEKTGASDYSLAKTFRVEKDSYFRIETRDESGRMLGLTNPIFVRMKK